jgi:hypothetical protein
MDRHISLVTGDVENTLAMGSEHIVKAHGFHNINPSLIPLL